MTISDAIQRADAMRPNLIPEEQKQMWLQYLEGQFLEVLNKRLEDPLELQADYTDGTADLLVPFPHDEVYVTWLMSKIDFANEEMELYANDSASFNAQYSETCAWIVRNYAPPASKKMRWW